MGPSPQQRIDEHIEVFTKVIPALDDVPAVTVNEHRQMRFSDPVAVEHVRSVFEVADHRALL
jgi:hypothetical protein